MANLSDVIYRMIDNAHPVGSYYLTETDTNPSAILHVGTWVQLKDRMLIGCGDSFAISSEGGEKEHVLTTAEMPSHVHDKGTYNITGNIRGLLIRNGNLGADGVFSWSKPSSQSGWSGISASEICDFAMNAANNWSGNSGTAGGSQKLSLMNPYHSCYIWRRTA